MSDMECPLPKRSQLRAARSQEAESSRPITAEIPQDVAPPPLPPTTPPARATASPTLAPMSLPPSVELVTEPDLDYSDAAYDDYDDLDDAYTGYDGEEYEEYEEVTETTENVQVPKAQKPRRNVHPVGYLLRALLIVGLAGSTIAVPMTGRVGSDSSLTVPARSFGWTTGRGSWASSQVLPEAIALDATLTADSRAKAKAPVAVTGCAAGVGADGNRNVKVVADTVYWPLAEGTYTITSPFTMRISPVSGQLLAHEGIDMAAPMDTPITAVYGGVVEELAENSHSGAYVQIKHTLPDGTVFHSAYLHQYMNKITVKLGDTVTAGQVIGAVGNNGWSTGPHLHFEIHDASDTPVDPEPWMAEHKAIYLGQEPCS